MTATKLDMSMVNPEPDESFEAFAQRWETYLRGVSTHQRIPYNGSVFTATVEPADVYSEMVATLFEAWKRYDRQANDSFGRWFWHCWKNRRTSMFRYANQQRRSVNVAMVSTDARPLSENAVVDTDQPELHTPPVLGINTKETLVWQMIRDGYKKREIADQLQLTGPEFTRLIKTWRQALVAA